MRKALVFAASVVCGAFLACGSSLSIQQGDGGGTDAGPDHDGTILVEASEPDTGRDVRPPTDARPPDAADVKAHDVVGPVDATEEPEAAAACLPESPDTTTGLFVTVGGSTSTACGSVTSPCSTIDLALTVAGTSPGITTLYVGPGKYTESATVALHNGMAIIGGWNVVGSTWTHSCTAPEIDGPSPVFSATSLSSPTTLDTLDIVETATAGTGVSLYGITSLDSMLALSNVSITVQAGGPGQNGGGGGPGGNGATGGCSPAGTGAVGITGDAGKPTGAGMFNAPPGGYVPPSDGTSGATGATGSDGTLGGYGAVAMGDPWCVFYMGGCDSGTAYVTYEGGTGLGGCPGAGGAGGTPASGGGCSIGVYAWGGSVTITGGTIQSGNGGVGGNGGSGGSGGSGEPGDGGAITDYLSGCAYHSTIPVGCNPSMLPAAGGSAGGNGGNGGIGGQGGGGAGGCSYAYYASTAVTTTVTATGVALDNGSGGVGGTPNGPVGPSAKHN